MNEISTTPPGACDPQAAPVEHLLLPDQNPNPVLVVDQRFAFVYQNRTARQLSQEMDLDGCRELLPSGWIQPPFPRPPVRPNGCFRSLPQKQIPSSDRLAEDLKHAALLVLPEQHRLSPASVAAINRYVRNGGRILATGSTRHAGLDELFDFESGSPKSVGQGQTLYLRDNLFRTYFGRSGYSRKPQGDNGALRKRTAGIFKALLPVNPHTLDAPPWIEWTLRQSADGKDLLVHLVNREINWALPGDLTAKPIRCSLELDAAPKAVTLEPGGEALKWSFTVGRLAIALDPAAVPHHRIIRITGTTGDSGEAGGSSRAEPSAVSPPTN